MQHHNGPAGRFRKTGLVTTLGLAVAATTMAVAPAMAAPALAPSVTSFGIDGLASSFSGSVAAPDGGVYHVGHQVVAGTNRAFLIVKSNADGTPDTTFGTAGRAVIDLVTSFNASVTSNPGAKETARSVTVDRLGRILVLGEVEGVQSDAVSASDTDVAVARLHPNGRLDTSYGVGGWSRISLSDGLNSGGGVPVGDAAGYTIAVRPDQKAVLTVGLGTDSGGARTSRDIGAVQLRSSGSLDTAFGDGGVAVFPTNFSMNVRAGYLDRDGSWFATGYANVGSNNQAFIAKFDPAGHADTSWGEDGLATTYAGGVGGFAEAYGFTRNADGTYLVSGYGYRAGRTGLTANNGVDAIIFGLKADGTLNRAWGQNGMTNYHFGADGNGSGDRHRTHVALPDGRIVGVGGSQGAQDAILTVTNPDGTPGEAITIDLGGSDDHLWGLATVGNGYQVVASGVGGAAAKVVSLDLSPAASATTVSVARATAAYGAANSLTINLASAGAALTGDVTVTIDGKAFSTSSVAGKATVALPRNLAVGSHTLRVAFAGSLGVESSSATTRVVVTKGRSVTTASVNRARIKASKRAVVSLQVAGAGDASSAAATGTVTVFDGSKKLTTVSLKAATKGKAKVTLPRLKAGKHTLTVTYSGNNTLTSSQAKVAVRVVK